ncbi:MAG: LacI family DNA-binding transcriptional regulator [Lachnospiraceae bacterium]|nr:LacI family DNA-binding transcriptional regulator [Lachnospiraceae bacterium]
MAEITIKDIANLCGVGVSTVSRAINNHPDINPETKQMIMQVIKEHDFVPNNSARNLKRVEANSIAVLAKGITNPMFTDMIKVFEEETMKRKYSLVLHHVESRENEVDVALELVKEKRLRGIIFLGGCFTHSEEKLRRLKVPFVFSTIGAGPEKLNENSYSHVSVDDRKESERMTEYLISLGHRDIAIIAAKCEDLSVGSLRLQGYQDALRKHDMPYREELIGHLEDTLPEYSMINGYQVTKKLIASGVHFTALYAIADVLAIGACRALREAGYRIPEDVSVAGYDGIELGEYFYPRLTTIRQPVEDMAMATIDQLFDILEGEKEHKHLTLEGSLEIKESTSAVS